MEELGATEAISPGVLERSGTARGAGEQPYPTPTTCKTSRGDRGPLPASWLPPRVSQQGLRLHSAESTSGSPRGVPVASSPHGVINPPLKIATAIWLSRRKRCPCCVLVETWVLAPFSALTAPRPANFRTSMCHSAAGTGPRGRGCTDCTHTPDRGRVGTQLLRGRAGHASVPPPRVGCNRTCLVAETERDAHAGAAEPAHPRRVCDRDVAESARSPAAPVPHVLPRAAAGALGSERRPGSRPAQSDEKAGRPFPGIYSGLSTPPEDCIS